VRPAAAAPAHARNGRPLRRLGTRKRAEFERPDAHERPASLSKALRAHKKALLETPAEYRHAKIAESAIERLHQRCRWNSSPAPPTSPAPTTTRRNRRWRSPAKSEGAASSIYGIREHGMAAAMNGIFLHGGFAPNGATFLIFTDYARPAMRLAALMARRRLRDDP